MVADLKSEKNKGYLRRSGYLRYFGPALMVSVACFDPVNFGVDMAGGAAFNVYLLIGSLWVQMARRGSKDVSAGRYASFHLLLLTPVEP